MFSPLACTEHLIVSLLTEHLIVGLFSMSDGQPRAEVVSKSLIRTSLRPGITEEGVKKFCLGIPGWCSCCEEPMEKDSKRAPKSLQLKRTRQTKVSNENCRRSKESNSEYNEEEVEISEDKFSFDVTCEELDAFKEGECPANTMKNTEWALKNFEEWRVARNRRYSSEHCPPEVLASKNFEEICEWLCKYVAETRKADSSQYTPRSFKMLLSAIQRHLRKINPKIQINIFQDPVFRPLKNVCDSVFRRLHSSGIGTETKTTPVLSKSDEDVLWDSGVINLDNPTGLLNAVFFYNGKNFCLRGGLEHRSLKLSQIKRQMDNVNGKVVACYVYTERGSKNNEGGFASLNQTNKVVRQYEVDKERCHVKILDRYLRVLPHESNESDVFYLKPFAKVPSDPSMPWFTNVPVGKNTLGTMMKKMCQKAGLEKYTNHSLRAYGTSTLLQASVPEKLIQQRTGHRSLEALRQYERTTTAQLIDVSNIMAGAVSNPPSTSIGQVPAHQQEPGNSSMSSSLSPATTAPTFILNGCTFTGCSVAFSGQALHQSTSKEEQRICDETLQGIDYDEIFDD